jgi:hypothetical protein
MSGQGLRSRLSRQLRRLLFHVFGGDSLLAISGAILFLLSIGWFADSLAELVHSAVESLTGRPVYGSLATLILSAASISLILWHAWKATHDVHFDLRQIPAPKVKALIFYLSLPTREQIDAVALIEGDLADRTFRERFGKNPLRIALEAIAHHLPKLETVVLLDSKEQDARSPGQGGSYELRAEFVSLLRRWGLPESVTLRYAEEFDPEKKSGIDFLIMQEVFEVTRKAYATLEKDGLPPEEILIDITGGTKITTYAGASVAIGERRSFQYVHTHTYEVLACNPEYDPAPKA